MDCASHDDERGSTAGARALADEQGDEGSATGVRVGTVKMEDMVRGMRDGGQSGKDLKGDI